tara:strand:- start:42227 stop:42889 length:663 start_codon:yes stop_codon:yes gene_type:complete
MQQLMQQNTDSMMSSREIAQLCGKNHSHVLRDIREMIKQIGNPSLDYKQYQTLSDDIGRTASINLNKDLTMTLITGYRADIRYQVIKRWQELEQSAAAPVMPAIPQTFSEALLLAGSLQQKIEQDAPKVAHYDSIVDRHTLLTATQVGQKVGVSATKLNIFLDTLNVYNKTVKRSRVFNTWFISKGLGQLKQVKKGYDQPLFTLKGEAWVVSQYKKAEVA